MRRKVLEGFRGLLHSAYATHPKVTFILFALVWSSLWLGVGFAAWHWFVALRPKDEGPSSGSGVSQSAKAGRDVIQAGRDVFNVTINTPPPATSEAPVAKPPPAKTSATPTFQEVHPRTFWVDPFLRPALLALIHELTLQSGKQARAECERHLLPDEVLAPDERVELAQLLHGRLTIADSLSELHRALQWVQQLMARVGREAPSYGQVVQQYFDLGTQRWVIVARRYRTGLDPNPSTDFRRCAHGLVEVDRTQLNDLKAALDVAEATIRATPGPDLAPAFRIDYLTGDLMKAGVPINGITSPVKEPTPQNDAGPTEYFRLKSGRYIRATMDKEVILTSAQKEKARKLILAHEEAMEKETAVLETVRIALIRAGIRVSSVRFTRSEAELGFDPERFVSVDSGMGILEVRSQQPFTPDQRQQIVSLSQKYLPLRDVTRRK